MTTDWIAKHLNQGHRIFVTMVPRIKATYWLTVYDEDLMQVEKIKASADYMRSIEDAYTWRLQSWIRPRPGAASKGNPAWGTW